MAPGNAGTATEPQGAQRRTCPPPTSQDSCALAQTEKVDLTIIGPEGPLVAGVVDAFEAARPALLRSAPAAAQLEGSKAFSKEFLQRHGIPTAAYRTFTRESFDEQWVRAQTPPIVVKASGLAAGKGVVIAQTRG